MITPYMVFIISLLSFIGTIKYMETGGIIENKENRIQALENYKKKWNKIYLIREQRKRHEKMIDSYYESKKYKFPKVDKQIKWLNKKVN